MNGTSLNRFDVVVIAGSAGGVRALMVLVSQLHRRLSAPVIVVQHLPLNIESNLVRVLANRTELAVQWASHASQPRPGTIYVAPPNSEVTFGARRRIEVMTSVGMGYGLGTPPADPLLKSVATHFASRSITVILTGFLRDGKEGVQALKRQGAVVLIQDPNTAVAPDMPLAAMGTTGPHLVLPVSGIASALNDLVVKTTADQRVSSDPAIWAYSEIRSTLCPTSLLSVRRPVVSNR